MPGIGLSPDKMLLDRTSAYAGAQRHRIGTNFHQLPVTQPKVPVNTHLFDGRMTYPHSGNASGRAPSSGGRNWSDQTGPVADGRETDGEMVRSADTVHAEDGDFGQAGTLVCEIWNDAQRAQGVDQVVGSVLGGVRSPVLERVFDCCKNMDVKIGQLIEDKVRADHAAESVAGTCGK